MKNILKLVLMGSLFASAMAFASDSETAMKFSLYQQDEQGKDVFVSHISSLAGDNQNALPNMVFANQAVDNHTCDANAQKVVEGVPAVFSLGLGATSAVDAANDSTSFKVEYRKMESFASLNGEKCEVQAAQESLARVEGNFTGDVYEKIFTFEGKTMKIRVDRL